MPIAMDQMESVGWLRARELQFGMDVATVHTGIGAKFQEDITYGVEVTTTRRYFEPWIRWKVWDG